MQGAPCGWSVSHIIDALQNRPVRHSDDIVHGAPELPPSEQLERQQGLPASQGKGWQKPDWQWLLLSHAVPFANVGAQARACPVPCGAQYNPVAH